MAKMVYVDFRCYSKFNGVVTKMHKTPIINAREVLQDYVVDRNPCTISIADEVVGEVFLNKEGYIDYWAIFPCTQQAAKPEEN